MTHTIEKVKILVQTPRGGVLIESVETGQEWIPQSSIHDDSEIWKPGDFGTLTVHGWIAEKKGWI